MRSFTILIYCFISLLGFSQTSDFQKGTILPKVAVQNSSETYALYLPKSFDASQLSAVMFVFDPSGNGANGLRSFTASAEKFNYILIASNATKNGVSYDTNFQATNRLFATVFSTFKIDEKRIYAAGFSGGSRLATAIAALTNKMQGVIACGAGLAINESFTPTDNMFAFVGLVGDEDMNYQEMFTTKKWLDKFIVPNELFVYNDAHRWPPSEQIERAFGWLELEAYRKKLTPTNSAFVQAYFESQYKIADSLVLHNKFRAVLEFESILRNFSPYFELKGVQTKLTVIKASPEYKAQVAQRTVNNQRENELYEKFSKVYSKEILLPGSSDDFSWWKKELRKLDADIASAESNGEAKMLKRLKGVLFAGTYESSMSYIAAKKYKHALYCDQLLTLLRPTQAYWYYRLAQSYARLNDLKYTVRNLKKAKELGLQRFHKIQDLPLFAQFKPKKKFKKLFEREE